MALAPKQLRFVQEYLIDCNGQEAYKRAGYAVKSDEVAKAAASRMLTDVNVAQAITEAQQQRALRKGLTADRVLEELTKIAFFDPRKLFREDGTPKHITELDDDTAGAIAGVEVLEEWSGRGEDRELV